MGKNRKDTEKTCSYSGKFIGNKEVVLVSLAVEYVKKMGYNVTQ